MKHKLNRKDVNISNFIPYGNIFYAIGSHLSLKHSIYHTILITHGLMKLMHCNRINIIHNPSQHSSIKVPMKGKDYQPFNINANTHFKTTERTKQREIYA
ncbi:hypothetical protein KFK09_004135 [Dendrobium nobile]|uniref:Uncharacterized protein n=1 Tax=Dendrobium nobile TaxID=94219 RepID=A0A8T3C365_DENNO|nr:hypothetical protein KFK09_004135 [Dendrobium nobile]